MGVALVAGDEELLKFIAGHDVVISSQVRQLIGEDRAASTARLDRLTEAGVIQRAARLRFQHAAYQITPAGLDRLGSDLPVPVLDVRGYWQGLALAWLWVHARKGHFGPVDGIYSRRMMRAADESAGAAVDPSLVSPGLRAKLSDARFAVDLGGGRVHYPGVVLVLADHGRVALEYLMTAPSRRWVDEVLEGYRAKPQVTVACVIALRAEWRDGLAREIGRRGLQDRVQPQQGSFAFTAT